MGFLFHIVLAVAALGFADLGWESPREWPWMGLVLALVPYFVASWVHRAYLAHRFKLAAFGGRVLAILPPVLFAVFVGVFGWESSVDRWCGTSSSLLAWPGPSLVPLFAPFVVYEVLTIDAKARIRALWSRAEGKRWRAFQVRMFASALVPIAVYGVVSIVIGRFPDLRTRIETVTAYNALFAGTMLVVLALFLPFLLRNTWDTEPIPPGPQRALLETVARVAKFRARELLVWKTGGTLSNAAIVGLSQRTRVVLFSDQLLAQLDARELAAVFAHEMGHAVKRHVLVFLALAGGFFLTLDWAANAALETSAWLAGGISIGALAFGYVAFGWLSRRFELEADLHSLALLRDPQALVDALEKVGGHFRDVASWRHFSTAKRVDFLVRAAQDANVGRKLVRLLRTVAIGAAVLFVVGLALQARTAWQRAPAELVRADLALGFYANAVERARTLEEVEPDLARLVARASRLDRAQADADGRTSVEELERRARAALDERDAASAYEWLALGALRERTDLAAIAEAVHALQVDPHAPVREALGDELWSAWGDALSRLAP